MILDPLLIHIQTHLRLGPLYDSQVSVGEWDGIYKFKESFRPDLRPQDGYPVVHFSESVLDASPASMKISVTSSSVESSQPSSTCRYRSYLVCTWCLTEMLSFRCWLVLLAMDLSTAGTRAFSTSYVNSQAISLIFVIIHLYSFSPSTWTNSRKIWVSLLY